jgi:hypothetical protein
MIREFTEHYRQHMQDEETRFFPLAEKRLSRDDWATLDFAIFDQDDPLFDHAAEERFSALCQRIERLAELDKARRTVLNAANELRELSGIESFNESMKSAGQPFRLARFVESGYGLERDRELLLYIPECSAERAAWCAYCYLLGRVRREGDVATESRRPYREELQDGRRGLPNGGALRSSAMPSSLQS